MTFEIDEKDLKDRLLEIYTYYISGDEKKHFLAVHKAKELDGLWSGSFLLKEEFEEAINNLTALYTIPKLSEEKAIEILSKIKNVKFS